MSSDGWSADDEAAWQAGVEIPDERWDRIDQKAAAYVARGMRSAPDGSPRARFALAVGLLDLLRSETLGKKQNQTLQQYDRTAWETLRLRKHSLEQLREQLRRHDDVAANALY